LGSETCSFHIVCVCFGAWHGALGWLGCRSCCASRRVHDAVHAHVRSVTRACVCARERACRSWRVWAAQSVRKTGAWRGLWGLWAATADWLSLEVGRGAWWRSASRWLPLEASGQRSCSLVMPARERERGEVGARFHCMLGSGGGVVAMLNAGWGYPSAGGERKEMEKIFSKISSGSSHALCPGATGQGF
jgi:hypothetical protein